MALRRHTCLSQSDGFANYNLLEEILLLMLRFMIVVGRTKQNELVGCETILFLSDNCKDGSTIQMKMSSAYYLSQMLHYVHYIGFLTVNLFVTDDLQNLIHNILLDHNLHCQLLQVIVICYLIAQF